MSASGAVQMHDELERHGYSSTAGTGQKDEHTGNEKQTLDTVRGRSGSQQTRRRRCSNPEETETHRSRVMLCSLCYEVNDIHYARRLTMSIMLGG